MTVNSFWMALLGSGEYLPQMEAIDRGLLARAPGPDPLVVCLATAAGREGAASVGRWQRMGLEHFRKLGARVQAAEVVDRRSADDPQWAAVIEQAGLVYFSGGDPLYLHTTLDGSRAWDAVQAALARGAVYAGCSAGAMVMGAHVPNIRAPQLGLRPAFGLVPGAVVLPHFDRMEHYRPGATQAARDRLGPGEFGLGIDEDTALVGQPGGEWEVQGLRSVAVFTRSEAQVYPAGARLMLPAGL